MIPILVTTPVMAIDSEPGRQSIPATVQGLPFCDLRVDAAQSIRDTLHLLDADPQAPGVLIMDQEKLVGMIPRGRIFERLGRPFGVELYLKLSNRHFYENMGTATLILPGGTPIAEAVKLALQRTEQSLYEPLVVTRLTGYGIVSMYDLLSAQQNLLHDLYSEVRQLSTKDPLTLINNRRGFFEALDAQLEAIQAGDLEFAFLMIDIDGFKNVNDRYGHLVGDEVIKGTARQIGRLIREVDLLGRFGGEEFVVFLRGVSREAAYQLAERLRLGIASAFQKVNGFQIRVTVSIGVSHSRGTVSTFDRLLTEADFAVYAAKDLGRNRTAVWTEDLHQPFSGRRNFRSVQKGNSKPSQQVIDQTLNSFLRMLYLRDYETEAHTLRVTEMALHLARKAGIQEERLEEIRLGALMHDIGKIAIPDCILFKPGMLTGDEWAIMRKHPEYAKNLLSPISALPHLADIPYCHHERWNGQGYPRGLRELEIPLSARIFSIVDVWDALFSDRPYRAAWREEDVLAYLVEQAGKMFDPELLGLFIECLNEKPPGALPG